jgi:hypothetical protein
MNSKRIINDATTYSIRNPVDRRANIVYTDNFEELTKDFEQDLLLMRRCFSQFTLSKRKLMVSMVMANASIDNVFYLPPPELTK